MLSGIKFDAAPATNAGTLPSSSLHHHSSSSSSHSPSSHNKKSSHSSRSDHSSSKKHHKSHKSKKEKKHKKSSKSSKKHKKHSKDEDSKSEKKKKRRKLESGTHTTTENGSGEESNSSDDSSSSSSDEEDSKEKKHSTMTDTVGSSAAASTTAAPSSSRDSWMFPSTSNTSIVVAPSSSSSSNLHDDFSFVFSSTTSRGPSQRELDRDAEKKRKEKEEVERKAAYSRGGLQGRHAIQNTAASSSSAAPSSSASSSSSSTVPTIGDGGASWRARALKRARERDEEESTGKIAPVAGLGKVSSNNDEQIAKEQAMWEARGGGGGKGKSQKRQGTGGGGGVGGRHNRDGDNEDSDMMSGGFGGGGGSRDSGMKIHKFMDSDTSMHIIDTEEDEVEQKKRAAATQAAIHAERARLMKRPTIPTQSPAPLPPSSAAAAASVASSSFSSSTPSASSWRDKLKKNLTGSAAPQTPEGDVATLYSTPNILNIRSGNNPSPSPTALSGILSASPSPVPSDRFAGMLAPSSLGMDKALLPQLLSAVIEEEGSVQHGDDTDIAVPQFAASSGFVPIPTASPPPSASPAAASSTSSSSSSSSSTLATGASLAELNKLSAQAQVAKLKKNMKLYDELQEKIRVIKTSQQNSVATASTTSFVAPSAAAAAAAAVASSHPSITLEDKLRLLQSQSQSQSHAHRHTNEYGHEVVVLPSSSRPTTAPSEGPQRDPTMKNKLLPSTISDGVRRAYFADDVKDTSLRDLIEQEKAKKQNAALGMSGGDAQREHDIDHDRAKSILKSSTFKLASTDEQFDEVDYGMSSYDLSTSKKSQKRSQHDQDARERSRQIQQVQRHDAMIESCWHCLIGSTTIAKSLILSIGVRCYLTIPRTNWLTALHCCIVPIEHTLSQTHMEDDVTEEVAYFKKFLTQMYTALKEPLYPLFLETVYDLKKKRHTQIECIPVSKAIYDDVEVYFTKALQEADEEWSTNKKIIKFKNDSNTSGGAVKRAIPKGFNYFVIEFGLRDGGLGHTIEDHSSFSQNFGSEILLGMLGESPEFLLRNRRATPGEETRRVEQFQQQWKAFDWTMRITPENAANTFKSGTR